MISTFLHHNPIERTTDFLHMFRYGMISRTDQENRSTMKPLPPEEVPRIEVAPQPARIDDILSICLRGFLPNQTITLHASLGDERGRTWTSVATFVADTQGCVDLASTAPVSGSYRGVDPMGLWWSATTLNSRRGTFLKRGSEPLRVKVRCSCSQYAISSSLRNSEPLSVSMPNRGNGKSVRANESAASTASALLYKRGMHSVQPVARSVSVRVDRNLPSRCSPQ